MMKAKSPRRISPFVRAALAALLLAPGSHVRSENDSPGPAPLRVPSPDRRLELTQSPTKEIVIRDLHSGKIIAHRPLGCGVSGAEISRVIWSPRGTGFMIEVSMFRGNTYVPYRITDKGVVDLTPPATWHAKLPSHIPDHPAPNGEFDFGGCAWQPLDWPDEQHFRVRWTSTNGQAEEDGLITFQIHPGNQVTLASVEDHLAGKPLATP